MPLTPLMVCHRCTAGAGVKLAGSVLPCPADGRDVKEHAEAGECPRGLFAGVSLTIRGEAPQQPSRGLGDTIAKVTAALGIRPCAPCKKRQEALNKVVPYRRE